MTNGYDLPEAIQWHEGMLLAPQHLQQLALRQEMLVHYHLASSRPFFWGVRRLRIDRTLLVEGIFQVLEVEAVMPDGLLVSYPSPEPTAELRLDLSERADQMRGEPGTVHLVVAALSHGHSPVRGEARRYDSVEGGPVADENTGEGELRIPRLRPRPSLLLTENPPARWVGLPLAKIFYRDERYELAPFAPPGLHVDATSELGDLCAEVASRLREKAVALAERASAGSVSAQVPYLSGQIHSLVAALPALEAALSTGVTHPYPLYLALCSLMGQVAALSHGRMPPVPEPYDHRDAYRCFDQVRAFIYQALAEGIIESHVAHRFTEDNEKRFFYLRFLPEWMKHRPILGVRARPGVSAEATAGWVEDSLVGSHRKIRDMRQKRVLGATRQPIERSGDLVAPPGVLLFELHPDPAFVEPNEALVLLNLDDPAGTLRPAEVILYVPVSQ